MKSAQSIARLLEWSDVWHGGKFVGQGLAQEMTAVAEALNFHRLKFRKVRDLTVEIDAKGDSAGVANIDKLLNRIRLDEDSFVAWMKRNGLTAMLNYTGFYVEREYPHTSRVLVRFTPDEGIGDGKVEESRMKSTKKIEALMETVAIDGVVNEDVKGLVECCGAIAYGSYQEQTFEDKVRQACGMLRQAISDEAMKGLGDDGRVLRRTDYQAGELGYWEAVDRMLLREIYPDRFKSLVQDAKAELEKYLETP